MSRLLNKHPDVYLRDLNGGRDSIVIQLLNQIVHLALAETFSQVREITTEASAPLKEFTQ